MQIYQKHAIYIFCTILNERLVVTESIVYRSTISIDSKIHKQQILEKHGTGVQLYIHGIYIIGFLQNGTTFLFYN